MLLTLCRLPNRNKPELGKAFRERGGRKKKQSINPCFLLHLTFCLKLHQVLVQLQSGDKEQDFPLVPIQVSISVQLWRLPGCHEFLAALGELALQETELHLCFLPCYHSYSVAFTVSSGFKRWPLWLLLVRITSFNVLYWNFM